MPQEREACITGLGALSVSGANVSACWESWLAGRSGISALATSWVGERTFRTRIAGMLPALDPEDWACSARDARWLDPVSLRAVFVAREALLHAGLRVESRDAKGGTFDVPEIDPERAAVSIGTGIGGIGSLVAGHGVYLFKRDGIGIGPLRQTVLMCIPNAPAAQVALRHGFRGECRAVATACAAGTMAIGDACRLVWSGDADLVVAGGTESMLSEADGLGLFGFDQMSCLSTRNDEPSRASRPFDVERDGFVLADGAAAVVIESRAHAEARGARVLARVLSYETTCQGASMVQPDAAGACQARLLRRALERAGLGPREVGAYNAHGTSTPAGDPAEMCGLRLALGGAADEVLVHSLKGATGHAIGGSGALEVVAAVRSLETGLVPPTANLEQVDEECAARHVVGAPAALERPVILKASFGFGGHDAALVLTR